MCKQFLPDNGMPVPNLGRNSLANEAAGNAGADQEHQPGPSRSQPRHTRLRGIPSAFARTETDRREPGRVPPHPVALPGTGPRRARRARRRPGLRGPEHAGNRGGHAGDHHRPGGPAPRPGPASPAPETGGRAAAAVRSAPDHRGRAGPLRARSRVHPARTAGEAHQARPGGHRVPPPGRVGVPPPAPLLSHG